MSMSKSIAMATGSCQEKRKTRGFLSLWTSYLFWFFRAKSSYTTKKM